MFPDFLIDCNLCMLNCRLRTDDFTNVSTRGKSVVDYALTPREQFSALCEFSLSDIVNDFNLQDYKPSDYSVLLWSKRKCNVKSTLEIPDTANPGRLSEKYYFFDNISASFLNRENSLHMISDCINRIELHQERDKNVAEAYTCFVDLIRTEKAK